MVSLGDDRRGLGGRFYDREASGSINSTTDSDDALVDPSTQLSADSEPAFRSISTPGCMVIELLLLVLLEVSVFVIPQFCEDVSSSNSNDSSCGVPSFSLVIYIHAILWFVVMLIDRYVRYQHFLSRRNGYLEFYRKTKNIRRAPFWISSGANGVLAVVIVLLNDYCTPNTTSDNMVCSSVGLTRIEVLQILVSIEILLMGPCVIVYLVYTCGFNRRKSSPDVHQEDMMASFLHSQAGGTDIGFRDEDYLDEVLEKQADMIRYLKQHNASLGKKILHLTQQLNQRGVGQ